jgi:hypothetical protein
MAVALQSRAWVRSRLITGTGGSSTAKSTYVRLSCLLCDVHVKGLFNEMITRAGEPYRVCMSVCGLDTLTLRRPGPEVGCSATEKLLEK